MAGRLPAQTKSFKSCPYARGNSAAQPVRIGMTVRYKKCHYARGNEVKSSKIQGKNCFKSCPYARGNSATDDTNNSTSVSSHAPTRGATCAALQSNSPIPMFQVMPLREGQPMAPRAASELEKVSSHAPTRGATENRRCKKARQRSFKSCPYARGNQRPSGRIRISCVSSHAPTRGATRVKISWSSAERKFQVMPLREGQQSSVSLKNVVSMFQVMPLREGQR